jgi:hypothetical protein
MLEHDLESAVLILRTVGVQREGSGACFVPVHQKKRTVHVYFLCNVKWHVLDDGSDIRHDGIPILLSPPCDFDRIFVDFGKTVLSTSR